MGSQCSVSDIVAVSIRVRWLENRRGGEGITVEHDESAQMTRDQSDQRVEQRAILEEIIDRVETNLERTETVTSSDGQIPQNPENLTVDSQY